MGHIDGIQKNLKLLHDTRHQLLRVIWHRNIPILFDFVHISSIVVKLLVVAWYAHYLVKCETLRKAHMTGQQVLQFWTNRSYEFHPLLYEASQFMVIVVADFCQDTSQHSFGQANGVR